MEIIAKYIHGSEDSLDVDTYYVVDELPSFAESKAYCDKIKDENANLITIKDGIVNGCYKGTIDEVNNSLVFTYGLHKQEYPLMVERFVERNKPLKYVRAVRGILSHLSRSQYRVEIKKALKGGWKERLDVLSKIDLNTIDFETLNNHMSGADIKKVIAFQIGQSLGLMDDQEFYTKKEIGEYYGYLKSFLYRDKYVNNDLLQHALNILILRLRRLQVSEKDEIVTFDDFNMTMNIREEKIL